MKMLIATALVLVAGVLFAWLTGKMPPRDPLDTMADGWPFGPGWSDGRHKSE